MPTKAVRLMFWIKQYWLILVLTGSLVMGGSGCAVVLFGAGAGAGVAGATYVMGKLEDEIDAPLSKVRRASVAALKSLDLPVDKDRADKMAAELESETADEKKIWISITALTPSRSKIVIRVGIMGDETRSRRILEAIHAHL
jgi:hypothetical protein